MFFNAVVNLILFYGKKTIVFILSNDSVNGFIISDAYETHNTGIIYSKDDDFISLDLIVSPDMHTYKTRQSAIRSFGKQKIILDQMMSEKIIMNTNILKVSDRLANFAADAMQIYNAF